MIRRLIHVSIPFLVLLAFAGEACAAQQRWASPSGSGATCSQASPCDLPTALAAASAGDEVLVTADQGDYNFSTAVSDPGVTMRGVNGRPVLIFSNGGLQLDGPQAVASHLSIVANGHSALALQIASGTGGQADDVIAHVTDAGVACALRNSLLTNSACWATNGGYAVEASAGSSNSDVMLRNVDVYGSALGIAAQADSGGSMLVHLRNVIAHGDADDLMAFATSGGRVTFDASHSNWATEGGEPRVTDDGTNQTTPPLLVDPADGDFHEAPGSATIDAGLTDPANGTADVDGDPRTVNGATDIGLDEFRSPPLVTTGGATYIAAAGAALNGTVNPNGSATTYHFDYGLTPAYGSTTPAASAGAGVGDQAVNSAATGLVAATTYHYRLVATNAGGTTVGSDATFTTADPPLTPHPDNPPAACSDSRRGTHHADVLNGTPYGDVLEGLAGNDRINGRAGDDCLRGGPGNDRLVGGPGKDRFFGGSGDDSILSADGIRESVNCGSGHDSVRADRGDHLRGCERVRRVRRR